MPKYDIEYLMEGSINGVKVNHEGKGQGDLESGVEELQIQLSSIPRGWHPVLMPSICSGPSRVGKSPDGTPIPTTLTLSDWHYYTEPGKLRLGELFDRSGTRHGWVQATGMYRKVAANRMRYHVKITSEVKLPRKPKKIEYYSYVRFPNGPNKLVAYSQFLISMVSGEPLVGVAKIPYAYESGKEARPVVGFQFIDTQLRGLKFKYRSATVIRYIPE